MASNIPFFMPLTPEYIKQIDQTARRILQDIGIHIYDGAFLKQFEAAGVKVDYSNQRIYFVSDRLGEILAGAPRQIVLYSRDGKNDLHLGEGRTYFANGGRVFRLLDIITGEDRLTTLADVANTAKMINSLDYIDLYIIACQAHDIEVESYHLNDFYYALKNTTKHVMGGCDTIDGVKQVYELASFIAGGKAKLREKPFVSVITNTISPLTIEANALQILEFCSKHGLPVTCAPAPVAGATSPASLAGTLAQMHAESLAGVAISQLFAPGAKILYGAVPTIMDLRNMELAIGSVEMGMMNAAAVKLAKLYSLPIYTSGGVTEAKRPDIQAGFEKSLTNLMVALAGADFIHLAAGMLDSGNSISYEQYIVDNELIGMIKRILKGIKVNEASLGFDTIKNVGPGGCYITEAHTLEHMMDEFFYPDCSVRLNYDVWKERGKPDMLSHAMDKTKEILQRDTEDIWTRSFIMEIEKAFPGIQHVPDTAVR
jgi:trimethylamine--corrinoid protein Co-methyltransferase